MRRTLLLLVFLCSSTTMLFAQTRVKCGIDNLIDTKFSVFKGKSIVLVSHAAARTQNGTSTAEEFLKQDSINVLRVLAPEHGYFGVITAGAHVNDDSLNGVPLISLYGEIRKPQQHMVMDADAIVLDLQDIGVRSYTYVSTMIEVMEACAYADKPLYILDRPNPLSGSIVDGSLPDDTLKSFVARIPIPYIHGMTLGEIAQMTNGEQWLTKRSPGRPVACSITVIKCKRWERSMRWEDTGLSWYPTSPNIPTISAVRGYPVTGIVGELGPYSIGIGTTFPFTVIGGPEFKEDPLLVQRLRSNGIVAQFGYFQPSTGKYAKQVCRGYHLFFNTDSTFSPFRAALVLLHTSISDTEIVESDRTRMFSKVMGSPSYLKMLSSGATLFDLYAASQRGVDGFKEKRKAYLLY